VGGTCGANGEKTNVYRLLVGKPEGKTPLGRPRRRWIDNNKMELLAIVLGVVDRTGLAQDRYRCRGVVNACERLRIGTVSNVPNSLSVDQYHWTVLVNVFMLAERRAKGRRNPEVRYIVTYI
jgi:hypothetical protein